MRRAVLLAVLLASLAPPALAQSDPTTRVLDDAAGDVQAATAAAAVPALPGQEAMDIVALDVEEQAEAFAFRLTFAGPPPQREVPLAGDLSTTIAFAYGGCAYQVVVRHLIALAGGSDRSILQADPTGGEEYATVLEGLAAERDGAVLTVLVPRTSLVDAAGAPAHAGSALTGFAVRTASSTGTGLTVDGSDPGVPAWRDEAASDVSVPVRFGVTQEGDLRLTSTQPFRASNGEAATFRFPVTVHNGAGQADEVSLSAVGVPQGWLAHLPAEPLSVPAGGQLDAEVAIEVPFAHRHGTFVTLTLEARGILDGAAVGRALLGLLYVDPPQPAGHHDTLWLHSHRDRSVHELADTALGSAMGSVSATWNTREEDPADQRIPVPPDFLGVTEGPEEATYVWSVPLQPALALGLDFDLARTGEVSIPITTLLPAPGATLAATVHAVRADGAASTPSAPLDLTQHPVLAAAPATAPLDLGAQSTTTFTAVLAGTDAGDYVPHAAGQQLWLRLALTIARGDVETGGTTPHLAPGAFVRLPLLEYSDRTDPALAVDDAAPGEQASAPRAKDAPLGPWTGAAALAVALLARRRLA